MPFKQTRPKRTRVPGIRQDGPSRFLVRVDWTDPTGRRRKREAVATSFAEAVQLQETLRGSAPTERPTRQRFGDCATQWLEVHSGRMQGSTREKYVTALAHLSVTIGQCYVDAITPAVLREWQAKERGRWANQTVNTWLRALRVVLEDAVDDGVLAKNPARAVKTLPEGRTKGRRGQALSVDQFRAVIRAIDVLTSKEGWTDPEDSQVRHISEDVGRLLKACGWTGMRRGEVLALRWCDIVDGEVRVERSVWRRRAKATKTDDPRRITVSEPLAEMFAAQRHWLLSTQHAGIGSQLVFPADARHARASSTIRGVDELCWFRTPSVMDDPLALVVKVAGVPQISVQSFRRTMENFTRAAGVEPLVRRALQGWRTERAEGIYATVAREERDAAATAVVRLVNGAAG
jgi:integrase